MSEFELFHIEDDPYDVSQQAPDKLRELNPQLENWLHAAGARMPKSS